MYDDDEKKDEPKVPQVVAGGGGGPPDEPDALAIVVQRNRAIELLLEASLRSTRPEHWTDHDGKPRLTSAGADVVARRFGVSVTGKKWERIDWEDEAGRAYQYIYTGTFRLPGGIDVLEDCVGEASSRDAFLGTGLNPDELAREVYEVKPGDILKKAHSNMIQRGVTELIGLRGMTWETLAKYGITKEGATVIQYAKGSKGGGRGGEFTFPYGNNKGQKPAEVSDKDLEWWAAAFERDLGNPEKEKYKTSNERGLKAIKEEQARRANAKAGATAAPATAPSAYERILAIARETKVPEQEIPASIKAWTGKASSKALTEEDVAKYAAEAKKHGDEGGDIKF